MDWKERKRLLALLENEDGKVIKDPGGRVNICLVFPNTYYVGMSNLGFTTVYSYLNSFRHIFCERAFASVLPGAEFNSCRPVLSLETGRRLDEFDLIGFSISYENDYVNVPLILRASAIPPLRSERDENHPVLFCGGFAPSLNPEPLAEIFDLIVLGDGEPALSAIAEALEKSWVSKDEFLLEISGADGVYVPSLWESGKSPPGGAEGRSKLRPAVVDLNSHPARTTVFARETEFGDMFLVEIARGCPKKCFFCGVGHRPHGFRTLSLDVLLSLIEEGLEKRDRVGLVGSAVLDHPNFLEIARFVLGRGGKISPASVRADRVTQDVADVLARSGLKTAALAPESGSERIRKRLGKGISDERFFEAANLLFERGIGTLKLYFVMGLPGVDEDEEVESLIDFVKRMLHAVRARRKKDFAPAIVLSLSGFVPKADTPFQFAAFPGIERLKRVFTRVKRESRKIGKNVRCEHEVPKYCYVQALLSLGDRKVSGVLAAYDGETDFLRYFRLSPVNPDYYVMRGKRPDEPLPWDFFTPPAVKQEMWKRYSLYLEGA